MHGCGGDDSHSLVMQKNVPHVHNTHAHRYKVHEWTGVYLVHAAEDAGASRFWGHSTPVRNSRALHCANENKTGRGRVEEEDEEEGEGKWC